MKTALFESTALSDVGRKRKNNEDACLCLPDKGLFCVADGMGGVAGGDLASEAVVKNLHDVFSRLSLAEASTLSAPVSSFRDGIKKANEWIKNFASEKALGQMGSTVVGLVFDLHNPAQAAVLHAGDSRLYQFRDGRLTPLTSDHSAMAALAAKLGRDPASLPSRYQNELLKAVGLKETLDLDQARVNVRPGDAFLLCSDGLTRMLPDASIAALLTEGTHRTVEELARTLVDKANEAGGNDNITVVLVRVGDLAGLAKPEVGNDEAITVAAPTDAMLDETRVAGESLGEAPAPADAGETFEGETPQTDDPTKTPQPLVPSPHPPPGSASNHDVQKPPAEPKRRDRKGRGKTAGIILLLLAVGTILWLEPFHFPKPAKAPMETATHISDNAYPTTLSGAQAALAAQDWTGAIALAEKALALKRNEPAALSIRDQAQNQLNLRAELEHQYQVSLGGAQQAMQQQDWTAALAKADDVLKVRPEDPNALAIRGEAQKRLDLIAEVDRNFRDALVTAQAALARQDWTATLAKADEALKLKPAEKTMLALRAEAQKQLDAIAATERDYQEAWQAAEKALQNQQWNLAVAKANEAQKLKPTDAAVERLKQTAQAEQRKGQEYQRALQAASEALQRNDYETARAQADAALALKPNDAAALASRRTALELSDRDQAQKCLDQGEYARALEIHGKHSGAVSFQSLIAQTDTELKQLKKAQEKYHQGNYSFLKEMRPQAYARKPPFVALLSDAEKEERWLIGLESAKQTNGWSAVQSLLSDPALARAAKKPPFQELAKWAETESSKTESSKTESGKTDSKWTLHQLDRVFETLLVEFNIKSHDDPYLHTAEGRSARRQDGYVRIDYAEKCLQTIKLLEKEYEKKGLLDKERGKFLKELQDTVRRRSGL